MTGAAESTPCYLSTNAPPRDIMDERRGPSQSVLFLASRLAAASLCSSPRNTWGQLKSDLYNSKGVALGLPLGRGKMVGSQRATPYREERRKEKMWGRERRGRKRRGAEAHQGG